MNTVNTATGAFEFHKVLNIKASEHGALGTETDESAIFSDSGVGAVLYVSDNGSLYIKDQAGNIYKSNASVAQRTAPIPGAHPEQPVNNVLSMPEGGALSAATISGQYVLRLTDSEGNVQTLQPGFAVTEAPAEPDLEFVDSSGVFNSVLLTNGQYSVWKNGISDAAGANGLAIVQCGKVLAAGANPPRMSIGSGDEPTLPKFNGQEYALTNYVGDVADFVKIAHKGEICVHTDGTVYVAISSSGALSGTVTSSTAATDIITLADATGLADDDYIFVTGAGGDTDGLHQLNGAPSGNDCTVDTNITADQTGGSWYQAASVVSLGNTKATI
jgi:hypothetical protein